jgi:hypothetical protein
MNNLKEIKDMLNDDEDLELSQSEDDIEMEEEEDHVEIEVKDQRSTIDVYNLYNPVSKSVYSKADNTYKFTLSNQDIQIKSKHGICFRCSCLDKIILIQKESNSMVQICNDCILKFI